MEKMNKNLEEISAKIVETTQNIIVSCQKFDEIKAALEIINKQLQMQRDSFLQTDECLSENQVMALTDYEKNAREFVKNDKFLHEYFCNAAIASAIITGIFVGNYVAPNIFPKHTIPMLLACEGGLVAAYLKNGQKCNESFELYNRKKIATICFKEASKLFNKIEGPKFVETLQKYKFASENEKRKAEIFQQILKIITNLQVFISTWQDMLNAIVNIIDIKYCPKIKIPEVMAKKCKENDEKLFSNNLDNKNFADAFSITVPERGLQLTINLIEIETNFEENVLEDKLTELAQNVLKAVNQIREETLKRTFQFPQ